jgi:predicted metal-dependent enzyme (double-stranded beta helix superfamily)
MFDLDQLIADCRDAVAADPGHRAVREVVARAVAEPAAVLKQFAPLAAGVHKLYHSDTLTILNVVWPPLFTIMPHDHRMWAVIGIYSGAEDNMYWRRVGEPGHTRIEAAGARALRTGDVEPLGRDIVHSVTNPVQRLTGAIHVYGGDFYGVERAEWDPQTLQERRYDREEHARLFAEANARFAREAS